MGTILETQEIVYFFQYSDFRIFYIYSNQHNYRILYFLPILNMGNPYNFLILFE